MIALRHRGITIAGALAVASLAVAACTATAPEGEQGAPGRDEQTGQTTQALTGAHKICSAITPENWRDTIEVEDAWSMSTCRNWAGSIGAPQWQVGCVFDNGFSWGGTNGGAPSFNCGW
jgi:hypothetical protein